jgi:tetratricopeptide (TPR) repeat protein
MIDAIIAFVDGLQRALAGLLKRLSNIGAAIVSPFERGVMAIVHAFFVLFERFEGIEELFGYIGRAFLWPFRLCWRLLASIGSVVVPRSARNILAAPFHGLAIVGGRIGSGLMRAAEAVNLDGLILRLVKISRPIWYPFAAVGTFFVAWAATRPFKKLLWGIPVLVLVLPILVATAWGAYWGKEAIAGRYRLALTQSLEGKDYPRAQLLERKLSAIGINTTLSEFKTAQALGHDGKLDEAYERMQRLAPVESPGYPLGHIWIIQHLLSRKLNVPADEASRLVGIHFKHLSVLGIKGPEIDMMKAAWLIQDKKLEEAAALLKPLVHTIPSAAIERFNINLALKHQEQARQDAHDVSNYLQQQSHDGNSLSTHEYASWAAAEQLLGNYAASRKVLREWLKHFPKDDNARQNVAALSLQEFDEILSAPTPNPEELARRLRLAFTLADITDNMKQRVTLLFQQQDAHPELLQLFDLLAQSKDLPASLAETLGTAAAVTGKWDKAQFFLNQSVSKDPKNAVAWNNLACALLQQEKGPLDKALAASNKAVELKPDDFRFRETRGEILLKLSRWQEAVDDLEYALNGLPDAIVIHQSLGKAYDAIGNKELAAVHRQYAN